MHIRIRAQNAGRRDVDSITTPIVPAVGGAEEIGTSPFRMVRCARGAGAGVGHLAPGCSAPARVMRLDRGMLSIATVNVNGVRAAYRRGMQAWIDAYAPDVILMQEVRAEDE